MKKDLAVKDKKTKLIWGMILIFAGLGIIVKKMNLITFSFSWNEYYPLIISIIGVILVFTNYPKKLLFPFFIILFGIFWFCYIHNIFYPYAWNDLYPSLFALLGVSLFFSSFFPKMNFSRLVNGLIITIISLFWLYDNIVLYYFNRAEFFIGIFLILIGIKYICLYFISKKQKDNL